jgi:hypothetical protein
MRRVRLFRPTEVRESQKKTGRLHRLPVSFPIACDAEFAATAREP